MNKNLSADRIHRELVRDCYTSRKKVESRYRVSFYHGLIIRKYVDFKNQYSVYDGYSNAIGLRTTRKEAEELIDKTISEQYERIPLRKKKHK